MDYRSDISVADSAAPVIHAGGSHEEHNSGATRAIEADYALFTSMRTPTGEGYRIVAASRSVTPDDKREITRRSPSHGGLPETGPDHLAFLAYPLAGGRYCVACCVNAGVEHTARGGQRIETHAAIFKPGEFRFAGADAVACARAVKRSVSSRSAAPSATTLEPLRLVIPSMTASSLADLDIMLEPAFRARVARLTWMMANRTTAVVMHDGDGPLLLAWAMTALPRTLRANLSLSHGIKFSLSRGMNVTLMNGDTTALKRAVHGHDVNIWDSNGSIEPAPKQFEEWIDALGMLAERGMMAELKAAGEELEPDFKPHDLVPQTAAIRELIHLREQEQQAAAEEGSGT